MNRLPVILFCFSLILVASVLVACDTEFQNNPHGLSYVNQLTPAASAPAISNTNVTVAPHLSAFGFGASLQAIATQYGQPTKYTKPPLYAFQDGNDMWPQGSLIVVTMKEDRAIEFSYVPGSDHPMTYQEAQDFAVKLLPDDAQGPKTVQQEDDHNGKCLAKIYHSETLKKIFPADDFISPDGKDTDLGSVTVNFYPNAELALNGEYSGGGGYNTIISTNTVNSVLINLGNRPSC